MDYYSNTIFVLCMCVYYTHSIQFNGFNKGYTTVPIAEMLAYSDSIDYITLEKNSITRLYSNDFAQFITTTLLKIQNNGMTTIHNSAFCGAPITDLYLDRNALTAAPVLGCIGATLTYLNLDNCEICSIAGGTFKKLVNLKTLYLRYNCLTSLAGFGPLKLNLRYLYLSSNALTVIDDNFKYFSNLVTLDLVRNNISQVDAGAFTGSSVGLLDLSHNTLTEFPDVRGLGSSTGRLYLSNNSIGDNIDNLHSSTLSQLYHLLLDSNQITQFPYQLCSTESPFRTALRRLTLNNNLITEISTPIGCIKVRTIEFKNNPLTAVPSLGDVFTHLNEVYLDGTNITSVPSSDVGYLSTISSLYLSNSNIKTWSDISDVLNNTAVLENLILSDNLLRELGPEIYKVPSLKTLDLNNNSISCLPDVNIPALYIIVTSNSRVCPDASNIPMVLLVEKTNE